MSDYIRINTEREHIFSPDIHVGIAAKINTSIDNDRIYDAIKALYHRHPLLTATIIFDEKNTAYYKLYSSKPIQIEFVESEDPLIWKSWMADTNHKPFDFQNGPMLKMLVIRSKGHTIFAVLGHHLLGDGISFVFFMRDFLAALDNHLDDMQLFPPIIQNALSLPAKGRLGWLMKVLAKKLNRDYRRSGKQFTYNDYYSLYETYNLGKNPSMCLFSLNTDETQRLIDLCRLHRVTVNEAITAAFVSARKDAGIKSDYLGVSCSIRAEMTVNPKEGMGNYVSGIALSANYDDSLDFWTNSRNIGNLLNTKLKKTRKRMIALSLVDAIDDSLIDAVNFAGFGGYRNPTAQKLCDILCGVPADKGLGISNLGKFKMDFEQFSVEKMWFVPPLFASSDFIVGVFTLNNEMNFCLRYSASEYEKDAISNLFEKAKSRLLHSTVKK